MTKKEDNSCTITLDALLENALDEYALTATIGNTTEVVARTPKAGKLKVGKPGKVKSFKK
jgi:hypothetical protein